MDSKVTTIQEAKDIDILPLDELIGSLKTHELNLWHKEMVADQEKKKIIALKAKKKFKADVNHVPTMEQTYIGRTMIAEEDMGKNSKIKVSGIYWTAYNKGRVIKKGEEYTITGIEGNKLIVSSKED